MFGWLVGLSPWWWVAFGIGLGALEMATMSFFLIWPGLAALLMAGLLALAPGMPGAVQVAVFAALSVVLTFLGRAAMQRWGDGGAPETGLNDRAAQMVGRAGRLVSLRYGEAVVEIDGIRWQAKFEGAGSPDADEGATVRITGTHGTTLVIGPDLGAAPLV